MKINNLTEEGQGKIREFVRGLIERNKVADEEKQAEQERLEQLVVDKVFDEMLGALSEEDLREVEQSVEDESLNIEKLNAMMFVEGIRPESITQKVFRDVEREYLGVENVESEENLIQAEEEE